jgi:hypothetical protein
MVPRVGHRQDQRVQALLRVVVKPHRGLFFSRHEWTVARRAALSINENFVLTIERAGATFGVEVTEMSIMTPAETSRRVAEISGSSCHAINEGLLKGDRSFRVGSHDIDAVRVELRVSGWEVHSAMVVDGSWIVYVRDPR